MVVERALCVAYVPSAVTRDCDVTVVVVVVSVSSLILCKKSADIGG